MVSSTDRPAMTIAVDLGRKATKQTNNVSISISALDAESERIVQEALDKVCKGLYQLDFMGF